MDERTSNHKWIPGRRYQMQIKICLAAIIYLLFSLTGISTAFAFTSGVLAVAAGGNHTVVLKSDGTVTAWGRDIEGQTNVPSGLTGVTAIAAGNNHTVALKSDGTVAAWGDNTSGQTAVSGLTKVTAVSAGGNQTIALKSDGTVTTLGNAAAAPDGLSGVIAIAAGGNHWVALISDGTVTAWGDDSKGQKDVPGGLAGVIAIAAGGNHTVALKSDGTVAAWGDNTYGQTSVSGLTAVTAIAAGGNQTIALKSDGTVAVLGDAAAVPADLSSGVIAITAGSSHVVALKDDGSVEAWGDNTYGQKTVPLVDASGVKAISGGATHSMALKSDGSIVTWGTNTYVQPDPPLSGITAIAAGWNHNVALKSDGTVTAWGDDSDHQTEVPAGLTNVIAISAEEAHSIALKSDGSVVTWGDNSHGESNPASSPTSGIAAVAAGGFHNLALKNDGTVVAWGWSSFGQTNVPSGLTGVVAIAAGDTHSVALKSDGTVTAWGQDNYHQTEVPAGLTDVVAIAAGFQYTLALKRDGTVTAWGENYSGAVQQYFVPATLAGVKAIAAGSNTAIALKSDGTVTAWGANSSGQASVPYYRVSVSSSGKTGGVVSITGNVTGLNCTWNGSMMSGTCTSQNVIKTARVTLYATLPNTWITDWQGCDSRTPTTCTINSLSSNITTTLVTDDLPTLTSVHIASNNPNNTSLAKSGDTVTLSFTSSEPVSTPTVTIAGHAASVALVSGIWTASYVMTGSEGEGIIPFSIAFTDLDAGGVGAPVSATTDSTAVTFDSTPPTLSSVHIISNNADTARAKTGDQITLSFTSSEPISTPVVSIEGHTIAATGNGATWSAIYTTTSGDSNGPVPFSVSFADLAGNPGVAVTATTDATSVTFDKTLPTLLPVHIVSSNTNTTRAKTGDLITLSFTSSEAISTPTVTLAGHAVVPTGGSTSWTALYTMQAGDTEGPVPFSISFADLTGNPGIAVSATTDATSVTFDTTAPTLSIVRILTSNPTTTLAKVGDTVTMNITASEAISAPTVTIAGHAVTPGGSGTGWTAAYTMTDLNTEGTVTFSVSYSDLAGNAGVTKTATTNGSSVTFDKTTPTLSIVQILTSNPTTTLAKVGDTVTLKITASEAISAPTVTIAGHAVTPGVSGTGWTAAYLMSGSDAEGPVTFSVSFRDLAGNAGVNVTAVTDTSIVTFDRTAPTLLISAPSVTNAKTGASVTYTVTYGGADAVTLSAANVALSGIGASGKVDVSGSGNTTRTIIISNLAGNGALGISISANTASDLSGNQSLSTGPSATFTVDNIAPTLVISAPSFTVARNATSVTYTVTYTGADSITLASGNITLNGAGSGVNGTVAVSGTDTTSRLVTISNLTGDGSLGITIAAGTASDLAGNYESLGAGPSSTFTVDNTQPTVTISSSATSTTNESPIPVSVQFSEPVLNFGSSNITVSNGSIQSFTGSGQSYSFVVTPASNGTVTVDIPANKVQDIAGNPNIAAIPLTRVFDSVNPATTIDTSIIISDPTNTSQIPVTVHFTKPVYGFTSNGVSVSNGNIGSFTGTDGMSGYSFTVVPISNGTVTVGIAANVAHDAPSGGNYNTKAVPLTRTYDTVAPTLTISTPSLNIATSSDSVSYTVTYSGADSVTLSTGDVTLNGTGTSGTISVGGSGNLTRTVTILNPTGNGTLGISINPNTASDLAGNLSLGAGPSATFIVDNTSPTVTISSIVSDPTNSSAIPVAVHFNKPVTGFTSSGVNVSNGSIGSFAGSGTDYSFTVTPGGNGIVTVNIGANVAHDTAGNGNTGNTVATQFSRTYDSIAPTVTIGSLVSDPTNTSTIPVTVHFSEPVTGFTSSGVSVSNGSLGSIGGSGADYSIVVVPNANGTVTVNIPANAAHDAAGNGNTASTLFSITYDTIAPTVAISSPSSAATNSGPVTFTVTYGGASNVGLTNANISLIKTGTANGAVAVSGIGAGTRTVTVSGITGNGTLGISVAAGTASDLAGNSAAGSGPGTTFIVDNISPTVTLSSAVSDPTNTSTIPVNVHFSEPVTGFAASGISAINGSIGSFAGSGSDYSFALTPSSAGMVTVGIAANAAHDAAGNGNSAAATFSRTYDSTAPSIVIDAPSTTRTNVGPVTFTVTYAAADSISLTNADISLIKTGTADGTVAVTGTGATRTVTISGITGDGTLGISVAAGTATDLAGNSAAAAGPSTTFIVDNTAPSALISLPSSTRTNSGPVMFTVTYTGADTISLGNSNVSLIKTGTANGNIAVAGTGATRTVTISGTTGDGTLGISVAAGTATDLAGNSAAAAGPSTTFIVDNAGPTVTISSPSQSAVFRHGGPVTFTATYSGADTITLYAGNILLNATGTANGTIAVTGAGGTTRTITISNITGDGTLGLSISANTARDATGNNASAAGPSATFTVDSSAGDLNGDNTVDMTDALKALRIAAGIEAPTASELVRGDVAPLVNGVPHPDGKIDINDVVVLLKMAAGLM